MSTFETKFAIGDEVYTLTDEKYLVKSTIIEVGISNKQLEDGTTSQAIVYKMKSPAQTGDNQRFGFLAFEQDLFTSASEAVEHFIKKTGIVIRIAPDADYAEADLKAILTENVVDMDEVIAKEAELKASQE